MKAEHVELRFGIIAREMGFISSEQLVDALKIQVMEEAENNKHRRIGTILLEKGLITSTQIEEIVLNIMKKGPEKT
jgi:hypothetical protein